VAAAVLAGRVSDVCQDGNLGRAATGLTGRCGRIVELADAARLWDPEPGWLNTASYGLPPRPAWEPLQAALADWRGGRASWEPWDESTGRARVAFARMTGATPGDVAVGATVSGLLAPVAAALPAGARVVVPEIGFTSNLFPWLVHADRGVTVDTVPLEKVADAIGAGTTLAAFSLVQSATGQIAPVDDILAAALVQAHNVRLARRFLAGLGLPPPQSAIVSVAHPGAAERLAAAGVRAATRAGGRGCPSTCTPRRRTSTARCPLSWDMPVIEEDSSGLPGRRGSPGSPCASRQGVLSPSPPALHASRRAQSARMPRAGTEPPWT
jgi:hypothetical protein